MSTALTTIRWLSIFAGALSLFYLGHAWFDFGLGEVFRRVHEWYVGLVHPVVDLLRPMVMLLSEWLGWSLPTWWKDAIMLYLLFGAATGRSHHFLYDAFNDYGPAMSPSRSRKPRESDDSYKRRMRRIAETEELAGRELALLPFRVFLWPIFLLTEMAVIAITPIYIAFNWQTWRVRTRQGSWTTSPSWSLLLERLLFGRIGSSVSEFVKIAVGAVIFAGLNAGLG
jgi:hypothetical protein